MKRKLAILVSIFIGLISVHLIYLFTWRPSEQYSKDIFLSEAKEKRALIIEAHDDDAISCAGTISMLAKQGWTIDYVTFYGRWKSEMNDIRKAELKKACEIQGIHSVNAIDFSLQKTDTVKMPWMPVPYQRFNDYFLMDSIQSIIKTKIKTFKPTILFTTDDVIGGYGHPEHVAVSKATVRACKELKAAGELSVKKIYQSVFTPSQAEKTIGDLPAFKRGKLVYHCNGMPEPSIQINIKAYAKIKKSVMDT